MNFVVRAAVPFDTLAPQFRQAVQSLDSGLPIVRMRSMEDVVDAAVARPRFMTVLLGVFAGLALLLAAVGTYGVLSYLVTERRQEIGIRMALGADRARILRLVLVRGLVLSGVGLAIGLAAALGLSRVLSALLFNVAPTDPRTLIGVSAIIAAVACVACVIPAWRATRVDPLVVLRDN
jgi:ABC-type antimicrobial peptide transport system permease subunit